MDRSARVFGSFSEADRAEVEYYASLTPQERLEILLEIIKSDTGAPLAKLQSDLREFIALLNSARG